MHRNLKDELIQELIIMSVFWGVRFSMLSISAVLSLSTIWIILRKKLQERLIMGYTLIIAICQTVMALIAILFGALSLSLNFEVQIDPSSHKILNNQTLKYLTQFEGAIFKSSQLISLSFTTVLTYIIYRALYHKDIHYLEKILRLCSIFVPIGLMVIMASFGWIGLCVTGSNYYNCVCKDPTMNFQYYFMWALPCVVLGVITFILMLKIMNMTRHPEFRKSLRIQLKLVLIIYYIPVWSFFIYLVDLILTTVNLNAEDSTILFIINNLIFTMPLVNLITTLIYKNKYERYLVGDDISSLLTSRSMSLQENIG